MRAFSLFCLFLFVKTSVFAFPQYYCTAANHTYFNYLVNLIGSIHRYNYDNVEEIAVFDLGMTPEECETVRKMDRVQIYSLKDKNPNLLTQFTIPSGQRSYLGWYAWKPVVIQEALEKFPYVLWMDAGCSVKKPLDDLFAYIKREGYFLNTSGDERTTKGWEHPIGWGTTDFVKKKFDLTNPSNAWILEKETVMGGMLGVAKGRESLFLKDWADFTKDIRHFADDGTCPGGWGACRHDQILLSVLSYSRNLKVHQTDFTQKHPVEIGTKEQQISYYATWNSKYLSDQTTVFIQDRALHQYEQNIKSIRYRSF